jgi:hypothetical protein
MSEIINIMLFHFARKFIILRAVVMIDVTCDYNPEQYVSGLFSGLKRPGHGVDHPPSSSAEV